MTSASLTTRLSAGAERNVKQLFEDHEIPLKISPFFLTEKILETNNYMNKDVKFGS